MILHEAYFYLLSDSFLAMLLLPFHNHFVFTVMKLFGTYNHVIMVILAAAGASIAAGANWCLGKAITTSIKLYPEKEQAVKLVNFLKKYEIALLSLTFIPFIGSAITTGSGLVGGSVKKVIPAVFVVYIIFFSLLLI